MKMPILLFNNWIIKHYDLLKHVHHRFIYLEMHCAVWGLTQAGILANKLLQKPLLSHGYYECANTPGLWKHKTRPISFRLVVEDFGVKYVGKEHLMTSFGASNKNRNSLKTGQAIFTPE
jgi:hypothetical protein